MGYPLATATSKKKLNSVWNQTNVAHAAIDIRQYFHQRKLLIDDALSRYLKSKAPQIAPALHQAMCYSALDAGKRFRPILTLAVGELFGAKRAPVVSFACAIELIHCYSLIHDDLPSLDNDDFRRGKPSCHKQFGEAIALLAGDALLTEAFFIVSDPGIARLLGTMLSTKLIREISEAAGMRGMISGQSREFELAEIQVTPDILEDLDRLKTGALITTAARVGAMIGRATRKDLERITRYARSLGLVCQITDDILDAHEISEENHKGIANYLSVAGKAAASERVQALFAECLREIEPYGKAAEPLREIAHYVTERTQ
jgi:geranylgeranyl diphosphate synthase, type II